jgi:DNA-binding MarR family transcriptional regulator
MSRDMRAAAVETLLIEIRELSSDFDSLSQAVADRVGLSATDLLAMDLISRTDRVTAGQIGDRLHMTSGAITGVIDRLERAGLAKRVPDSEDRRRVLVMPTTKENQIRGLYDPLVVALQKAAMSYSDEDLAVLNTFIGQVRAAVTETSQGIRRG